MSEVVQGALVGIAGTIIGVVITALFNYMNNKSNVNLRIYELKTSNMIKAREGVLIPLRKTLTTWLEFMSEEMIILGQISEYVERKDKVGLIDAIKRWFEVSKKRDETRTELRILVNQIHDSQLIQTINEIETYIIDANSKEIKLAALANKPENMNSETISRVNKDFQDIRTKILSKVLPFNKRIEELLVGESSS